METIIQHIEQHYKIDDSWTKTARFYCDLVWYTYSLLGMIPLFLISLYRYINHPKDMKSYSKKNLPPRDMLTTVYKFFGAGGSYYYIIDVTITLIEGSYFQFCRWPFFYHHIIATPVMLSVNRLDYVPWFIAITPAMHAMLLAWPQYFFLNIIYVVLLINVHYRLYDNPYYSIPAYNFTRKWYVTFYIAMGFLGYTECKNELPFL